MRLAVLYQRLLEAYGPQGWWPAQDRFEVLVGAILTQNTAWLRVEQAIARLCGAGLMQPEPMAACPTAELERAIRPAGHFRVKAGYLKAFCYWFVACGGFAVLDTMETEALRQELLGLRGIGPETADSMLLYAFGRPVFVVDAYTRRLLQRLGHGMESRLPYGALQAWLHERLAADTAVYNEFHALIVTHGKAHCRTRPACADCALLQDCAGAARLPAGHGNPKTVN